MRFTRRQSLIGASAAALLGPTLARAAGAAPTLNLQSAPLAAVRLSPSIYADAQVANRAYLASLDPERFLHNFYLSAGLPAPKPVYGGWEAQGIAGHSLGHWLSAVSIEVANGNDAGLVGQLDHCLAEMARIQAAHGDGYCGGTTVERDGKVVDGKIVFEELRRGEIASTGFDLNGGWVPLYTWHKIHAGLIDAHRLARNPRALPVMLGVAGYLAGVLEGLSDEQLQQIMRTEFGGLNDSYAETYALTGEKRWLDLAKRLYHRAVLDPLVAGEDRLAGLHANTQIPKVIGLARIHELDGSAEGAEAARFFHQTVTQRHSYVIGGNSEHEHFGLPDQRAHRISEATCEACNSYNMLKLTRHLYAWQGDASLFDFYERVHLNHIMAHQRPRDGSFVYFMPLSSGARRYYSEPDNSFWCCVGTGMESHAKHMDSIYWADGQTLYVNLYIPSQLDWDAQGIALDLQTRMPDEGQARLTVRRAPRGPRRIALRIPAWSKGASLALNGKPVAVEQEKGYAVITRRWREGDTVELVMPMALTSEAVPDDPSLVAFLHGPRVLAADLGPDDQPFARAAPALLSEGGTATDLLRPAGEPGHFTVPDALGGTLAMAPFFAQYDRRTAVYFPTFTAGQWAQERGAYLAAQDHARELARRTVDRFQLGEMQPERDHRFVPGKSEVVNWNGRAARRIAAGDTVRFALARRPGAGVLQVIVFGAEAAERFSLTVDGEPVTPRPVQGEGFLPVEFALPDAGEQGRDEAEVTLTTNKDGALVYEAIMLTAD
ncbi:glycoside hydrolase family 127 protein [Aurantiacibacter xanthus]|nr:glycoside hydrolase family 127 protein [Aurantiacibacter xanthus]